MKLENLMDLDLLAHHLKAKNVRQQFHPRLPLRVLNYSQLAQYGSTWDSCTKQCRGLVVDDAGEVVARPWPKFFSLADDRFPETLPANLPTFAPEVTTKLDGFLLILSWYDNQWAWASRGSFDSPHARWAAKFWQERHPTTVIPAGKTCLFEGLCADLRIVVKYPEDAIVLLAAVDIEDGHELDYVDRVTIAAANNCPLAPLSHKTIPELEAEMQTSKEGEGYVISWLYPDRPSLKLKMKSENYLRLFHLITGVSPRKVWEALRSGEGIEPLVADTPADFREWVEGWATKLRWDKDELDRGVQDVLTCSCLALGRTNMLAVKADRELRAKFAGHVKFFAHGRDVLQAGAFACAFAGEAAYEEFLWKQVEPSGEAFRREI
jgi:RNA ligase